MSCPACKEAQQLLRQGQEQVAFVRVGTGNVMVVACLEHLRELLSKLWDK